MHVRAVVAVVAVVIAVAGALVPVMSTARATPASPGSGSHVGWINVSATGSYGYTPPYFEQVPTNATITVTFTDGSDLPHTFTIINKEGWVVPTSYTTAQVDTLAYGTPASNLDNGNVSGPGAVNVTTFTSPGPGWYEFICTVSGHFQLGMYGFIAFGTNLPSNLTGSGGRTGVGGQLSFNIWDAAIVAVLVAVIVAGYLHIRRRQRQERYGR